MTPAALPKLKRLMTRQCNRLVVLTGLLFLVGCSSYESKWQSALSQPMAPADISGRWEGTWTSGADQHTGALRCVLTRTGQDAYSADYNATYWKYFHFGYAMPLKVDREDGDTTYFHGSTNLGLLAGGEFTYDGRATPDEFFCEYRSKYDFGSFHMTRPPPGEQAVPTTQQ